MPIPGTFTEKLVHFFQLAFSVGYGNVENFELHALYLFKERYSFQNSHYSPPRAARRPLRS